MVILGVLLLVAAVVVLTDMALTTHGTLDVHVLGWHLGTLGAGRALLLAAGIGAVVVLGACAVLSGQRRSRRHRKERDRTIAGTRAENRRLAAELDAQRSRAAEAESLQADAAARSDAGAGRAAATERTGRAHLDAAAADDSAIASGISGEAASVPRTPPPADH